MIAELLVDGKRDKELEQYIPRYYLDMLNYREIRGSSQAARHVRYKEALIGTYGAQKGRRVEDSIREKLEEIKEKYGVSYGGGRSRVIETDIDFAIPSTDDHWVIIMCSFQETTSSGQTTKAKDMLSAYERVCRLNSRYDENRAFVNFADGVAGWQGSVIWNDWWSTVTTSSTCNIWTCWKQSCCSMYLGDISHR